METVLLLVAIGTFCYLIPTTIETLLGLKKLVNLRSQPLPDPASLPSVSIILSALNEEKEIENALISLLNINYPALEVIAVDDRSTDNTFAKMQKLKERYPQLQTLQIKTLPEKWFGKNHALHVAAQQARGDWLLFTDADVDMKPDLLSKAMGYISDKRIDHLTIYEYHPSTTFWRNVFLFGVYLTYTLFYRPWRIRHAWSKKACGHGIFNLVNKKVYHSCGGHQTIAMECLDDMKLGELIKTNGFKQDTVDGRDYLQREWYGTLPDAIEGMRKNTAAFGDYKLGPVVLGVTFFFIFYTWPAISLFFCSGAIFWINLLNVLLLLCIALSVAKHFRVNFWYAFIFPVSILLLDYFMWDSFRKVYKDKGVFWRGTLYPIEEIRSRNVLTAQKKSWWSPIINWRPWVRTE